MSDEIEIIRDEDVEIVETKLETVPYKQETELARSSRGAGRVIFEAEIEAAQTEVLARQMMSQLLPPGIALGAVLERLNAATDPRSGDTRFDLQFSDGSTLWFIAHTYGYK